MGEFLKCIDPERRWIWQHPEMPAVRFEYKALAGPTFTRDLGARYLNDCITRAWCVSVDGVDYEEWNSETDSAVEWSRVLPTPVANALFLAVALVSSLDDGEQRDSPTPSGQPSLQETTTATDAGGPAGSAHDGKTPARRAGNGSAKAPKHSAGRRS